MFGATKVYPRKMAFEPNSAVYDPAGHPYHVNFSAGEDPLIYSLYRTTRPGAVATFFKDHNPPYPDYEGLVADINKGGLRRDKSTLGFLNSALYLNPSVLNRITDGPNLRCNTIGFSAVEGGILLLAGDTELSEDVEAFYEFVIVAVEVTPGVRVPATQQTHFENDRQRTSRCPGPLYGLLTILGRAMMVYGEIRCRCLPQFQSLR
jgi:hypothetical protein